MILCEESRLIDNGEEEVKELEVGRHTLTHDVIGWLVESTHVLEELEIIVTKRAGASLGNRG